MTDDQLAEIRARLEAATPGPWRHYHDKLRPQFPLRIHEIQSNSGEIVKWSGFDGVPGSKKQIKANAKFIANAPTDIATLLDEVERLQRLYNDSKTTELAYESAVDDKGRAYERIGKLEGHLRGMLKFEKMEDGARERITKVLEAK